MKRPRKSKHRRASTQKRRAAPLRYEQLLKLARRMRPPQSWYDEAVDPFAPETKSE